MAKLPWEFHADLGQGRLLLIAKVLRDTRRQALAEHNVLAGDTQWGLGCCVYDRSTQMLMRAGEEMWSEWFRVVQPPLEFLFAIGDVLVRFYSGDPHDPGTKHLKLCEPEMEQRDFVYGDASVDLIWRIAVEPNAMGDVARVVLIGTTAGGETRCFYEIPDDGVVSFLLPLDPSAGPRPGVTLPPATVTLRSDRQKKDDDKGRV